MELKATLKEAVSQKGNSYYYVSLMITPNYEKKVFLEQSELELIKLVYSSTNSKSN